MGKYIIELDDDIAKGIRGGNKCKVEPREIVRSYQATIADAIANGTPYKPVGDIISREALKNNEPHYDEEGYRVFYESEIDNAQVVPLPNNQVAWAQGFEAGLAQGKHENEANNG